MTDAEETHQTTYRWLLWFHQQGQCNPLSCRWCNRCCGYSHEHNGPPCCERAGEYNGYGSDGALLFECPRSCGCHD